MPEHPRSPRGETCSDALPHSPEETAVLLSRVRTGDDDAVNALLTRMLPRLRRWAHGRLPAAARGMLDTGDIVQTVASKAVKQLARLDGQEQGSLGWYLRQAIRNEIATEWRRAARAPQNTGLGDSLPGDMASPLERVLVLERFTHYEAALNRLDAQDRDAVVGRFELAYDYDELARYLGKPSAGAARVAVHRAVKRLAEHARDLTRALKSGQRIDADAPGENGSAGTTSRSSTSGRSKLTGGDLLRGR